MKWSITIDKVNQFTGRWERLVSEVFTGSVSEVEGQVSFEALGCGSAWPEPRRVHVGETVVAVTLSEGEFCVTATRL